MLSKIKVIETVNSLPEWFSIEEMIDRLVLLQKIEIGIEQSKKGEAISNDDAKKRLSKNVNVNHS